MRWNWQEKDWPNFKWDASKLEKAEQLFSHGNSFLDGALLHLNPKDKEPFLIEIMTQESLETSAIEGEYLKRDSVRSSIARRLGFSIEPYKATPAEEGISEVMVNLYQTIEKPLTTDMLFDWHRLLMKGRHDLTDIGCFRTHLDPMQIVSGPDYQRKVHYEAPPSVDIPEEMDRFLDWTHLSPHLPAMTRAGLAHLWFESLHPFEDGNGRLGRLLVEKFLAQSSQKPLLTGIATPMNLYRKDYYNALAKASRGLDVTDWLLWFATIALEAQKRTQQHLEFIVAKSRLLESLKDKLNKRQEKALLRVLQAGPAGFKGGLSARNYETITGSSIPTTTRDLVDLVQKGAFYKTGTLKGTRYHLNIPCDPIQKIIVENIL